MIGSLLARRALADAFDALNRRDLESFMSGWCDDGYFEYPGDVPASGTFRGRAEVEGWFRRFLEQFPIIEYQVRQICLANLFDFVGTNVGAVHWDVRLVNRDGREVLNNGVTVVGVRGGKAAFAKDYMFNLGEPFHRAWGVVAAAPQQVQHT